MTYILNKRVNLSYIIRNRQVKGASFHTDTAVRVGSAKWRCIRLSGKRGIFIGFILFYIG